MVSQEEKDVLQNHLKGIAKKVSKDTKVICFGNNDITALTISALRTKNISVDCIFDNRFEGKSEDDIPVVHPGDYPVFDKAIVLIGSKYFYEMKKQLLDLGYKEKQIIQTISYHGIDIYKPEVTKKVFLAELGDLLRAKKIYKKLLKNVNKDGMLFICTAMSAGDIYLIIMYTRAYAEFHGILDYHYLIIGGVTEKICKACDVTNYSRITMDEMLLLRKLARFAQIPDRRVLICNTPWAYTNLAYNCEGYGVYDSFAAMYKKSVLGIKSDEFMKFENPMLPKVSKQDIHNIFNSNGLKEGKTVLLAPYTQSLKSFSDEVWIKIAAALQGNGFSVCTNCVSEKEKPVKGTMPIKLDFNEITAFIETAGIFIGARSGLCDVISGCRAKLYIVYPKRMWNRFISAAEYFGLHQMKLTDSSDVKEYVWDSEETAESTADEILTDILQLCK